MSLLPYHLISLLQQQIEQNPSKIALEGFEMSAPWDSVSWQQLAHYTKQLSQSFIDFGLQVQDKVAILATNCPQWTCVDIATLQARNVLVPIYPTNTQEQAAYIINDSQAKVLCVKNAAQYQTARALREQCPTLEYIIVFDQDVAVEGEKDFLLNDLFERQFSEATHAQFQQLLADISLDDLFTLIYTSGTTGEPKGVMLDYRNVASSTRQHDQAMNFEADDVSLAFLPLSHIFERAWSFYVLSRGGKNVYLGDTNRVKDALEIVRPHVMCVVPRFLEKVYSAIYGKVAKAPKNKQRLFHWAIDTGAKHFEVRQGRADDSFLLNLQWAIANKLVASKLRAAMGGRVKFMPCGGAALEPKVNAFFQAIDFPVLCGYGMTETVATITCNTLANRVIGSNGQCLPEVEIKIGAEDEILVRGDTVMRGYYNRPDANAEVFEDGWLKTGDAGRIDEQGNLFITDRIKELMKTSTGKYIAPQRVEGIVSICPLIEQVAIVADSRNYVTALIVPAFEALEAWATEQGVRYNSRQDLVKNTGVKQLFEQQLETLQQELASFEQIKKFTLLPDPFSMEAGLITPTMKLRRKVIYNKYSQEINAMYPS